MVGVIVKCIFCGEEISVPVNVSTLPICPECVKALRAVVLKERGINEKDN